MNEVEGGEGWEALRVRLRERCAQRGARLRSAEPAAVLQAVARQRAYWRGAEVRVLLLGESHVETGSTELAAEVSLAAFGHPQAPAEFVRLVYCLGFGEPQLLGGAGWPGSLARHAGTPQTWMLLAAAASAGAGVADGPPAAVLKGVERDAARRVRAKIAVLEALRARGVWLLDASPLALHRAGGSPPPPAQRRAVLEVAFEEYARAIVQALQPRAVMVLGWPVHEALAERLRAASPASVPVQWMHSPQAHVPWVEHRAGLLRLGEMVRRYGVAE